MRDHLARHARTFVEYGDDLPPHEVNYEQSMVAPLLELLLAAHQERRIRSSWTNSLGGCPG